MYYGRERFGRKLASFLKKEPRRLRSSMPSVFVNFILRPSSVHDPMSNKVIRFLIVVTFLVVIVYLQLK